MLIYKFAMKLLLFLDQHLLAQSAVAHWKTVVHNFCWLACHFFSALIIFENYGDFQALNKANICYMIQGKRTVKRIFIIKVISAEKK